MFSDVEISNNANVAVKYTAKNFANAFIQLFKNSTRNVQVYVQETPPSEFANNKLTFYVYSKTDGQAIFEVYTGEYGAPESVRINDTTIDYGYDSSTNLVTFNITLTSSCIIKIEIIWK